MVQGHLAQSLGHICKALGSTSKQGAPDLSLPKPGFREGVVGHQDALSRLQATPGGGAEPVLNKMRMMRSPSRAAAGSWSPQVSLPLAHVAAHGAPAAGRQ